MRYEDPGENSTILLKPPLIEIISLQFIEWSVSASGMKLIMGQGWLEDQHLVRKVHAVA